MGGASGQPAQRLPMSTSQCLFERDTVQHPKIHSTMAEDLETANIKDWQSIVTLIVFIITNAVVLVPFDVPVYIPRAWSNSFLSSLAACHLISPVPDRDPHASNGKAQSRFAVFRIPISSFTAPLLAALFLLAIRAIGRQEIYDGTVGADHINPIDNVIFLITMAYIGLSIDASGLVRYLAFRVAAKGRKSGFRLFFYTYTLFFVLGSISGNDPLVDSATAFLAYMTRASANIHHPRAWIYTLFAVANISSTILVSSSATNVVAAGAFKIKYATYTANVIVPVVGTAVLFFPFLLFLVFPDESLIPSSIRVHELSDEAKRRRPVNPHIPYAGAAARSGSDIDDEQPYLLSLEEVLNPFLNKRSALFGGIVMATTVIMVLAMNAASDTIGDHPVFWITLPAACAMFCWDMTSGWLHRKETREIVRKGRRELEQARADRAEALKAQDRTAEVSDHGNCKTASHCTNLEDTSLSKSHSPPCTLVTTTDIDGSSQQPQARINTDKELDMDISFAVDIPLPENDDPEEDSEGNEVSSQLDRETQNASLNILINHARATKTLPGITRSICDHHCSTGRAFSVVRDQRAVAGGQLVASSQPVVAERSDATATGVMVTRADESQSRADQQPVRTIPSAELSERGLPLGRGSTSPATTTTLAALVVDGYRYSQKTFPTATVVVTSLPFKFVPFALSMSVLVQALVAKGWVAVLAHIWDRWVEKTGTVGTVAGMGFMSVMFCNVSRTNTIQKAPLLCRHHTTEQKPMIPH
jgi:Na+/H+ antiporter NhaD/arsenite permease-like protein